MQSSRASKTTQCVSQDVFNNFQVTGENVPTPVSSAVHSSPSLVHGSPSPPSPPGDELTHPFGSTVRRLLTADLTPLDRGCCPGPDVSSSASACVHPGLPPAAATVSSPISLCPTSAYHCISLPPRCTCKRRGNILTLPTTTPVATAKSAW